LIRPAVWPQYANVTDRTNSSDRQTGQTVVRYDAIWATVLQTVAQALLLPHVAVYVCTCAVTIAVTIEIF